MNMPPVALPDEMIVIANTNKRRGLADSKYNERRAECEEAFGRVTDCIAYKSLRRA